MSGSCCVLGLGMRSLLVVVIGVICVLCDSLALSVFPFDVLVIGVWSDALVTSVLV